MNRFTKRVIVASLLSILGFALTFTWYNLTDTFDFQSKNAKPVARLVSFENEVQRKPVTKLMWQPVSGNEILYAGEAIRTGLDAQAVIEFLNSDTKIDLEPESAVVIEESSGDLALNFLQGNMYVKSDGKVGDTQLTVKSGGKNIALGKSEISLGKTAGQDLNLQVLNGSAQVDMNGKTVTLDEGKSLEGGIVKITHPLQDEPLYVDPKMRELVEFTWQPLSPKYKVFLEAGPTRNSLRPAAGASAAGDQGKVKAGVKPGRVYYRLVARSDDPSLKELSSPILRTTVYAKTPPTLLEPENMDRVSVSLSQPTLKFAWTDNSNFEKVLFEISRDAGMKKISFHKEIKDASDYFLDIKTAGVYYWRLSGYLKGVAQPVASDIHSFTLDVNRQLPTPRVIRPAKADKMPFERVQENGVLFAWEAVPGATHYVLKLEDVAGKTEPKSYETKLSEIRVKDLSAGSYKWTLTAKNSKESSKPTEIASLALTELPALPWADGKTLDEQYYISLRPSADLKWAAGPKGTKTYRLRFTGEGTPFSSESPAREIAATQAGSVQSELAVPKEGRYLVEVEALDGDGQALARTPTREVRIFPAPLLPAPEFAASTPEKLEASQSGQVQVEWQPVQGAETYTLLIKDAAGEKRKEVSSQEAQSLLRGLMPGEYKISLRSVDQHGRPGPEGEERILRVPATSSLRAPKVKGVKVK